MEIGQRNDPSTYVCLYFFFLGSLIKIHVLLMLLLIIMYTCISGNN